MEESEREKSARVCAFSPKKRFCAQAVINLLAMWPERQWRVHTVYITELAGRRQETPRDAEGRCRNLFGVHCTLCAAPS